MNEQEILLRQTFHEELLGLYKRTVKELKYKSPRLLEMMNKYGGYEAVIKILPTDAHTFDFTLLWEQERLDLSIEALVTKERYKTLFPEDVITFCQKRLDEYNYAPKKLKEDDPKIDDFINDLFDAAPLVEEEVPVSNQPSVLEIDQDCLERKVSQEEWEALFMNTAIFTAKNQDMIIKMYGLGGQNIRPEVLGSQEGYTLKYPFYEVIMALAKRIKSSLKLQIPLNEMGKPVWWQILFIGMYHSNQDFSWTIREELMQALTHLMEMGKLEKIECPVHEVERNHVIDNVSVLPDGQIEDVILSIDESVSEARLESNPECCSDKDSETIVEPKSEISWEYLKSECLDYYGAVCDLCGFDFGYTYGKAFENFIQVHVLKPYSEDNLDSLDPHKDLVPICCNCEAVLHSKVPHYTLEEVKEMLAKAQKM